MRVCVSVDEDNIITGYGIVGSIKNGIDISVDSIPHDLCDGYYRLIGNEIVLDEELKLSKQEETHNKPGELTENEMLMLAVAELDIQREQDKIETQLAIAELAETLLGGGE